VAEIKGGDKLDAALVAIARKLGGQKRAVRVGWIDGRSYPGTNTSVAMVAAVQNFGAPARGVPARPFFTNMIAEKSPGWPKALAACLKQTNNDAVTALDLMGEGIAGQLEQAITNFQGEPLSPVTLLLRERFPNREGMEFSDVLQARADVAAGEEPSGAHASPLIWTGIMRNSIAFEVN